jgi:hypothetical protein
VKLGIGFAHLLHIISGQRRKSAVRRLHARRRCTSGRPGDVHKIEAGDGPGNARPLG